MDKKAQVEQLTTYMANFVSYIGKVLPDDIKAKIDELAEKEDSPLSKVIYQTMQKNQVLAKELNRPSCQDTGVLQFWVKCGTNFPLIGELEALLKEAVVKATFEAPLRHNSVETFDEYNTGKNVGKGTPTVFWDIVPDSDQCEIYTYMAGGGCTLPGKAMVLMPGEGYEGVTKFVLDVMTSYGLNACPPLLVGVGVATSVETAALLSKKALMRPLGSYRKMNVQRLWRSCLRMALTQLDLDHREWAESILLWEFTLRIQQDIHPQLELLLMLDAGHTDVDTLYLIRTLTTQSQHIRG